MLARTAFRSAAALAAPRRVPHHVTSLLTQSQLHIRYASTKIKVPQMAESISEGTLKQFSKAVGDYVEADEEVATIETDKIDVAVNAPEAGTIKEILVSEEDTVTVGQDLIVLETGGEKPAEDSKEAPKEEKPKEEKPKEEKPKQEKSKEEKPEQESKQESKQSDVQASPAKQEAPVGGSRGDTQGTPPKQEQKAPPPPPQPKKTQSSTPAKDDGKFKLWSRDERRVKMNRMRLRIAERLKQAQNTAASLSTFQEVDMTSLLEMRSKFKDEYLKKTGIKMGFMGAFARAATLAMKEIPSINAGIEGPDGGDTIVYHDYVDISVAVATEKGLTTPIVRNVESMNLLEVEKVIAELGKKARDGKLTIEDMAGGTFTISNGGVFGSLMSTPIINPPQAAVLGLHAIFRRAREINGEIKMRSVMKITLTYDHRLIDGREAATFLVKVRDYIEDPRKMLFD